MKTLLLVLGVLTANHVYAENGVDEKRAFIEYLVSDKEPSIKDATWMSESSLYIGMVDNGSKRDGFAEYICLTASQRKLALSLVKIVDVMKVRSKSEFVELGRASCAN